MTKRSLLLAFLLLAACSAAPAEDADGFRLMEQSADAGFFAFTIEKDGALWNDFGVSHTKEMHLIVVRNDLEHFQHLHPERDQEGVWRVPLMVPAGGTYWIYADFADSQKIAHLARYEKEYPGDGVAGFQDHLGDLVKDPDGYDAAEKVVDGYRVQVATLRNADGVMFYYTVLDAAGRQVVFEDYLGEKGHSVLIAKDGEYLHTHPFKDYVGYKPTDRPIFFVGYPKEDFYRIFTQFQIKGKIITVDFDWNVPERPSDAEPGEEHQGHAE